MEEYPLWTAHVVSPLLTKILAYKHNRARAVASGVLMVDYGTLTSLTLSTVLLSVVACRPVAGPVSPLGQGQTTIVPQCDVLMPMTIQLLRDPRIFLPDWSTVLAIQSPSWCSPQLPF
jgi:hypothetical protein